MPRIFWETDRDEFTRSFAVQFLASYAASIYEDCCQAGELESLERLPVEDAEDIATKAFDHWIRVFGSSETETANIAND